jgi:hypothetical protein
MARLQILLMLKLQQKHSPGEFRRQGWGMEAASLPTGTTDVT